MCSNEQGHYQSRSLIDQIRSDRIQAMKDKDSVKKNILSVLLGEIENKSVGDKPMSDDAVIALIKKYIVNNGETLNHLNDPYSMNGIALSKETEILSQYLPQQLTANQIAVIVSELLKDDVGLGVIMNHFKSAYAGRYDGKQVSEIARAIINIEHGISI